MGIRQQSTSRSSYILLWKCEC